jgi:hypothetical protein
MWVPVVRIQARHEALRQIRRSYPAALHMPDGRATDPGAPGWGFSPRKSCLTARRAGPTMELER